MMQSVYLMPNEIDEVSQLLGQLSGKLDALTRQAENNDRNARGRWAAVHKRLDDQDEALGKVVGDVRYMKTAIDDDIRPVTDRVKRWEQQGMGALAIIGVGGSAFGALVLWVLSQLHIVKLP